LHQKNALIYIFSRAYSTLIIRPASWYWVVSLDGFFCQQSHAKGLKL
jgi:hypothetical protein